MERERGGRRTRGGDEKIGEGLMTSKEFVGICLKLVRCFWCV